MEELKALVHQHMADQAYEEWCAGRNPMVLPWNDKPISGVEAIEKHITYLEKLLLCGFSIFDNDAFDLTLQTERPEGESVASGSGTVRAGSEMTVIHSPSQAAAVPAALQQRPGIRGSHPVHSDAQAPPTAVHPRVSILRGVSGLRREFVPGVEWRSTWLSRRETNNRRNAWRRGRGI